MGLDLVTLLELVPSITFLGDSNLEFACIDLLFVLLRFLLLRFLFLLSWRNFNDLDAEKEWAISGNRASHCAIAVSIVRRADQIRFCTHG